MVRWAVIAAFAGALGLSAQGPRFLPDDPIHAVPDPLRVEKAKRRKLNDYYDFLLNTFVHPGERQRKDAPIPAAAVNTLGEVPDSEWFTNRHGKRRMSLEELRRGPGDSLPPSLDGPWRIVSAKTEGITPGFMIVDSWKRLYLLKFDPPENPEMATAADVIGSRFFHAIGYNVPQNYLVRFQRSQLVVDPKTRFIDSFGERRQLHDRDVDETLLSVRRDHDGSFRGLASLIIQGESLGEFRYFGTRKDDPNDVVPHEHRRDLRGLFVFCAWLGHEDSRSINTLDFLVEERANRFVKHYLIDFGATLGSASTKANSPRSGNEYLFSWKPAIIEFLSLGLYVPPWSRTRYPRLPSVGLFEAHDFDPEKFRPEYFNPAFSNRLPDDEYWAAKVVMAFSDDDIRAIVQKGGYSDPKAESYLAQTLIQRRDKIGRVYFKKVLPLDSFRTTGGRLEFRDRAEEHGFVEHRSCSARWSIFDNDRATKSSLPGLTGLDVPRVNAPYLAADINCDDSGKTVTVYLRRRGEEWTTVGVDRTW